MARLLWEAGGITAQPGFSSSPSKELFHAFKMGLFWSSLYGWAVEEPSLDGESWWERDIAPPFLQNKPLKDVKACNSYFLFDLGFIYGFKNIKCTA